MTYWNSFHALLDWLEGKKALILSISAAVLSYAVAGHLINPDLGALLQTILSILGGGAVYATNKLGAARCNGKIPPKEYLKK